MERAGGAMKDTPEIVAAKAKKAMDVGQEALRIFGGKK